MINNIKDFSKKDVHDFWDDSSCGEELFLKSYKKEDYEHEFNERYRLEPCIDKFMNFKSAYDKKILEIGVGLGADHQRFVEAGAITYGIDLTKRAIKNTERRLNLFNYQSNLSLGDSENIQYKDNFFDLVYSWGVIHHSPDTQKAINEIYRVLKPGGIGKVMIYHKWSLVGLMLWIRYGFFKFKPLIGLKELYANFLESPGTKAYSINEARRMFKNFNTINIDTVLTHGDLLDGPAGQRHKGILLSVARKFWPRKLIKYLFPKFGLFMLVTLKK